MSCERLATESPRASFVRWDGRAATIERSFRRTRRRSRDAFSLVELMVVMVIMGMLVGLAAVRYRSYLISSKQSTARTQIAQMVKAIETFYAQEGRYPATEEGIEILAEGTTAWPDGYLDRVPLDPWKRPYEYLSPGSTQPYEVICLGADGREGGEGENRDISSEDLSGDAQE
jgi:general secretion pathway protein G